MYTWVSFDTYETTITMKKMNNIHHPLQFPYPICNSLCPTFNISKQSIVLLPVTIGELTLSQVHIESNSIYSFSLDSFT